MASNEKAGARATYGAPRASIPLRQLAALCGYSLVIWSLGNGILPLLPKVAANLSATAEATGLYLAISYAAIALGTVTAGWIADRTVRRKRVMLAVGLAGPPIVAATSLVTAFWQLVIMTSAVWWLGGSALAFSTILAGVASGPTQRGRVLGVLAMMAPLGSIFGGFGVGRLADSLGYVRMWLVLGMVWLLCPAAGLFVRDVSGGLRMKTSLPGHPGGLWRAGLLLLLACGILGAVGSFIGSLGRSFVMMNAFSAEALTSTVAVSGIATVWFPPILGWLSDRLGRLRFIGLCYAAGTAGLLVYASATALPEFWLASSLAAFLSYVAPGVGSALVVDLVERPAVGRGLALYGATGWVGGVLGFAIGGYVAYPGGFLLAATVTAIGITPLIPIGLALRARRPLASSPVSVPSSTRKE